MSVHIFIQYHVKRLASTAGIKLTTCMHARIFMFYTILHIQGFAADISSLHACTYFYVLHDTIHTGFCRGHQEAREGLLSESIQAYTRFSYWDANCACVPEREQLLRRYREGFPRQKVCCCDCVLSFTCVCVFVCGRSRDREQLLRWHSVFWNFWNRNYCVVIVCLRICMHASMREKEYSFCVDKLCACG